MNSTTDGEDKESRLSRRKERQRIQLKLKREQDKYLSIILKRPKNNSSKRGRHHFGMEIRIPGNGKVMLYSVLPFVK